MGFLEIFLIAVGLSMDAFAVAVCKGLKMKKINLKQTSLIALFFGGFQALMPLLGWLLGSTFKKYFESFGHWIAFGLLLFIGGKMIYDTFCGCEEDKDNFDVKELLVMAVATSIDAFAVGVSFAMFSINIFSSIVIIGVTTFVLSALGVLIGCKFGEIFKNKATLFGGIILILIGLKILLEGLGLIPKLSL